MAAYNLLSKAARANKAGRQKVLDPGDGGTISSRNVQPAVCVVTGGTTRSLEAASRYGLGDSLLVISQTSTITVASVAALSDGEAALFIVTLDSNGDKQWVVDSATDIQNELNTIEAYLERAVLRSIIPLTDWRVHDAPATVLPAYADDDSDDLQIVTPTIGTTAVTIRAGVTNATVTKEAIAQVAIPSDYVAGSAISIVIPWTRADAATTSSTLDVTCFRVAAPTVDICATAAQDINAAASGTATFVLTPTNLTPGQQVLINLLVAVVDGTTSVQELTDVQWSYTPAVI